jgi:hypothetical protein
VGLSLLFDPTESALPKWKSETSDAWDAKADFSRTPPEGLIGGKDPVHTPESRK